MTLIQAAILGIVQGLTDFIPISSSGHLVLLHQAMGTTQNGLAFDVALHIGTLLALLIFFNKDIVDLAKSLFKKTSQTKLAWLLALATLPAVIAGVLLEGAAESAFRSSKLVSINLIAVALLMLLAERFYQKQKTHTKLEKVTKKQAIIAGIAQAASIVPGVSRSGSTITAGIFSGMDRVAATRFSFLLAIPITAGAISKVLLSSSNINEIKAQQGLFAIGITTALISGLFAIKFLLNYLNKHSLAVFAYYRIVLGVLVLLILTLS